MTISEGRNRIIRRSFDFFGYTVIKLFRLSIGPISLGAVKEGEAEDPEDGKVSQEAEEREAVGPGRPKQEEGEEEEGEEAGHLCLQACAAR